MSDLSHRLNEEYEKLKTRRDELRVQLDLGKKEAQDAWEAVDEKWGEYEQKMKLFARFSRDAASDVGDAAEELVEDAKTGLSSTRTQVSDAASKLVGEIREGFERIKSLV